MRDSPFLCFICSPLPIVVLVPLFTKDCLRVGPIFAAEKLRNSIIFSISFLPCKLSSSKRTSERRNDRLHFWRLFEHRPRAKCICAASTIPGEPAALQIQRDHLFINHAECEEWPKHQSRQVQGRRHFFLSLDSESRYSDLLFCGNSKIQ